MYKQLKAKGNKGLQMCIAMCMKVFDMYLLYN